LKTAKELGIYAFTRKGLIQILGDIKAGRVIHTKWISQGWEEYPSKTVPDDKIGLNMKRWGYKDVPACGSVHCIGGLLESRDQYYTGKRAPTKKGRLALDNLFGPDIGNWNAITVPHVSRAIQKYLNTGVVDWAGTRKTK
jgi:hypothetical protein